MFGGKENWLGEGEMRGWGEIKTFIPALLGQVREGSLEIKLLQMCFPDSCECAFVSKENLFGVGGTKGMGGDKNFYSSNAGASGGR